MPFPPYVLRKWGRRQRARAFERRLIINEEGIVLGRTLLAKYTPGGLHIDKERVLPLLAVAYGREISERVIVRMQQAEKAYGQGDKVMALMHLALTGLPAIDAVDTPLRLFAAEWLLSKGETPHSLLKCVGFSSRMLAKDDGDEEDEDDESEEDGNEEENEEDGDDDFDSKHPRWPAGSPGGVGGEFAPKDSTAAVSTPDSGSIPTDNVRTPVADGMNGPSRLPQGVQVAGDNVLPNHSAPDQALGEKSKEECIEECSEKTLPTNDFGASFFRCLNECLGQNT